jgi:hypothetical protein
MFNSEFEWSEMGAQEKENPCVVYVFEVRPKIRVRRGKKGDHLIPEWVAALVE